MSPALTALATFLSVALFSGVALSALLRHLAPEHRRLRQLAQPQPREQWHEPLGLTGEPNRMAERINRVMPRSEKRMREMRRRLVNAGLRSSAAPVAYAASQIVGALVAFAVVLAITRAIPVAILGMVAGFALPGLWLSYQIRRRGRVLRDGLPDVLDLLIVCLESGCSLDQAILKTGEELALAYKPLEDELGLLVSEIRAGTPRHEAFKHLAERTNVDDVRSLVAMLVQTDRYGTSIAQALRLHADLLRTRRRQRAEERAAKASVKLVIPLVLCLFPAFYILTLGPAMLQFFRLLMVAVNGQ